MVGYLDTCKSMHIYTHTHTHNHCVCRGGSVTELAVYPCVVGPGLHAQCSRECSQACMGTEWLHRAGS